MTSIRLAVAVLAVFAAGSCTRRVVIVRPPPQDRRDPPPPIDTRGPSTAVTLGIPPGHLPRPGECRIWIPGTPPGRQPGARSRRCAGIGTVAPEGTWIVYRPTRDRRLVHVFIVNERRMGRLWRVRVFDFDSGRHLRDEDHDLPDDRAYVPPPPRERPGDPPRDRRDPPSYVPPDAPPRDRPVDRGRPDSIPGRGRPDSAGPPRDRPGDQGRERPDSAGPPRDRPDNQGRGRPDSAGPPRDRPDNQGRGRPDSAGPPRDRPDNQGRGRPDSAGPPPPRDRPAQPPAHEHPAETPPAGRPTRADLDIPPGQMPQVGECRVWIPGTPPGRQPGPRSRSCDRLAASAPAGSWVLHRPTADRKVVRVQVVDVRRFGVITEILIYDVDTGKFVRQENP